MKKNKIALSLATTILLSSNMMAQNNMELGKMTVTAQKSEENIQDIPLSITAFDEFSLEDKNVKTIEDIAAYTPNLYFSDPGGVGVPNPSLRGISSSTNFSTSATMFIDGIPITGRFGYKEVLEDIERIEVLKGPQGTLYGKDTHAGVINVITKKPTNETKSKIGLELGSDNKKELSASASGAIIKDKLFIGIAARHYEKDGFIRNINNGRITDDRKDDFGKINLRYKANDNLEISLINSLYIQDDGGYKNNAFNNRTRTVTNNHVGYNKSETRSHSLKIEYDINNEYKFESLTAYRQYQDKASCDNDYSSMVMFETVKKDGSYEKIAQEFRLNKLTDKYKLVSGLYFDKDTNDLVANVNMFDGTNTYMNVPYIRSNEDGKSMGLFTHIDYKLNNNLSIIGGARYDKDERTLKDRLNKTNLSNDYGAISPKVALEYNLNKNSMLYTTVSKGYKSGGYHSFAPSNNLKQYDKETLISYEIGSKNILLDGNLVFNSAIYYMDIDDMQILTTTSQAQSYISNAAKATSKGFELDANYRLSDNFTLTSAFGYNSTKLDKFKDATGDYSGKYNPHAPKYNYNIGIKYRDEKGIYASADLNGYGKTYFSKDNRYSRDSYDLVNVKIGHETDNYDIYLYGKNIFDKVYDSNGEQEGYVITYSEPRELGIQLAYRF